MSNGSEAIFMPTMSVYDTNMMAAYINAVKGEYERSLEDYDKFVSKYGDFVSPILKDVEYWNDNTFGQFDRTYNDLVAAGIDPVRSKEGQAIMRRAARNIPYAQLANIKQNAKDAEKYNEVVRQLKLQNKYDESFADWQFRRTHGGVSMRNWDSSMGVFGADVPSPYQSLQEATKDWYEGLQNGYLGTQNGYDYFGKSPDAVRGVIAAQAPNLTSEYWLYLKDRIRSVLGPNASEEAVNSALQSVLFDSARNVYSVQDPTTGEWSNATREENKEYGRSREYAWNTKLEADKSARDYYYDMAKAGVDVNNPEQVKEYQEQMRLSRNAKTNNGDGENGSGYSMSKDVYVTSLAKAAGMEYLPSGGVDPLQLNIMLNNAAKNQKEAIIRTGDLLSATGMFISPEKIAGLILSDGKDGGGYFLNPNYFKNLHDILDMKTSYKDWGKKGSTREESNKIRQGNKLLSKDIVSGINEWLSKDTDGYRLKVVPVSDLNYNNTYGIIGDDGKWHTYLRVRVYMSNGKDTKDAGKKRNVSVYVDGKKKLKYESDIPKSGKEMVLEVGLTSNKNAGTPDLSLSSRENLGFYGFDATKEKIGLTGNSDWPYGTNILSN